MLIQVDTAVREVQPAFQRVAAASSARVYSESALNAELKKLDLGVTTALIVIQYQDRLTSSRSVELRALIDYQEALSKLAFVEGRTLARRGFEVNEK